MSRKQKKDNVLRYLKKDPGVMVNVRAQFLKSR